MSISLEEVTSSNYEAVCDLDVTGEQHDYVASNMWSLVESHYCQGHTCRSFGFQEVGLDEDGEDMLAVIKL